MSGLFLTPARDRQDGSFGAAAPRTLGEMVGRSEEKRDRDQDRLSEIRASGKEAQIFTQNATNLLERRRRAYDERIFAVREATGTELENPFRLTRYPSRDELSARLPDENIHDTRKRLFSEKLVELQRQYPAKAPQIRAGLSLDEEARRLGQDIERRHDTLMSDPNNPDGATTQALVGSIIGYMHDPLQFATLFAGGGSGTGTTVAARILSAFVRNAGVNATVEAGLQVPAQAGREEAGLASGFAEGARNVGLAALVGGVFGGTIRAGVEVADVVKALPGITEPVRRAAAGNPLPGDLDYVARELKVAPDPETRAQFETAIDAGRDDAAAFANPPEGITADEAARIAREAVEQAADDGPPVSGAVQKPARAADVASVVDEVLEPPGGGRLSVDGKPVRFVQFDPETIGTDAVTYQYKAGGDGSGVTDRLVDVKKWDPTASGKTFVHERLDGTRFVADGHQRLGLAKRLKDDGQDVQLDGYLFRERDGWGPEDVRALAAKKNMQEGSGTPLDAARILRDSPKLLDKSLPVSGPMMRKAIGLSRLSDDAFGMTVNGIVPENQAALVGEMVPDPALHGAVLQDLVKFAPETERQARLLIGESLSSGRQVELQNDMFGSFRIERTLMGERVKVLDAAIKALKGDKRLFGTLADNAEVIEAAGNRLDTGTNTSRAEAAELIAELLNRMSRTRGPVSDALSRAARQVAEGGKPNAAGRAFIGEVQGMIDEGGLGRLLSPPEPELKPAASIEPGTPDAGAQADELAPIEPSAAELEQAGQGAMWDMLPDGVDVEGNSRFTTSDGLDARATRDAELADLVKSCKD